VPLSCDISISTDLQEVHVCLDDKVFCMGEAERGCEGGDGSRSSFSVKLEGQGARPL